MMLTMSNMVVPQMIAMQLAAAAGCDPRTAARALREGPHVIRGAYVRGRIEHALSDLGLEPLKPEAPPAR